MPHKKNGVSKFITLCFLFAFTFLCIKFLPTFKLRADGDTEPPALVDFVVSDTSIDTGSSTVTVDIYARLSDVSGVSYPAVTAQFDETEFSVTMSLVSEVSCEGLGVDLEGLAGGCGDEFDGIFYGQLDFLHGSPNGDWPLVLEVSDSVDNSTIYDYDLLTAALYDASITVTGEEDTEAPEIVDIIFDPSEVNFSLEAEESRTVKIYARITDDKSGMKSSFDVQVQAEEGDAHYKTFALNMMEEGCDLLPESFTAELTGCGDVNDGIYEGEAVFARYSPKGLWTVGSELVGEEYQTVGSIVLMDRLDNQRDALNYDPTFSSSFTNTATVHDIESPVLKSLEITPTTFNSANGNVTVTVSMSIEDNLSGVKSASASVRPLIHWESAETSGFTKASGTYTDGVFEVSVLIPQGSKLGFWTIDGVSIEDNVGNSYGVNGYRGLSMAFPNLDLFFVNQALANSVLIEEDWYIEEWNDYGTNFYLTHPEMSIKFESGTVVSKKEGGIFAFHRMLTRMYEIEGYTSFSDFLTQANTQLESDLASCDASEGCVASELNDDNLVGDPVKVIKIGIPGLNLTFSKPVTISLAMDEEYLGQTFVIQTFDPTLGVWSNQSSCTVAITEPSSYEHGGGEFGSFMPAPYPACSFTTDHASFFSMNVLGATNAGVPNTGIGGAYNYFTRWLRK